jgi:hypothetical protein
MIQKKLYMSWDYSAGKKIEDVRRNVNGLLDAACHVRTSSEQISKIQRSIEDRILCRANPNKPLNPIPKMPDNAHSKKCSVLERASRASKRLYCGYVRVHFRGQKKQLL